MQQQTPGSEPAPGTRYPAPSTRHAGEIGVGIIGYGIGKVYAAALRNAPMYYHGLPTPRLVAIATAGSTSGHDAVEHFGFERYTTDYHELVESPDVEAVVIASPNYLHTEMVVAALRARKAVYVDKPLADSLAGAMEVAGVARETGRDAQVSFVMRFCPALQYARKLIQEGRLGRIYSFRASYYRGSYINPDKPLRWKGVWSKTGGGVLSDYLPHIVDLVNWLVGVPDRVVAQARIFVAERPESAGSERRVPVETDDHLLVQAELPGGTVGTFEASRLMVGPINDMRLEIYGSEGSLRWSVEDTNYLYFAEKRMPDAERGWLAIPTMQRYEGAVIPGADLQVGMMRFHIGSMASFLAATRDGRPYQPGLADGVKTQAVLEAAAISAREGTWTDVPRE